jgi:integration host factor subunit beta
MDKAGLIEALRREGEISRVAAKALVEVFFDSMAESLANSGRVEVRGLCSFYVKEYKGYTGRNPKTKERVKVKPKKLPYFKCGQPLKERVNKRGK